MDSFVDGNLRSSTSYNRSILIDLGVVPIFQTVETPLQSQGHFCFVHYDSKSIRNLSSICVYLPSIISIFINLQRFNHGDVIYAKLNYWLAKIIRHDI